MTTPNRKQIEAKAIEKFFEDQHSKGFETSLTPTTKELKESGYYAQAQHELMKNDNEYISYLEQECASLGFELVKQNPKELVKQSKPFGFEIDVSEALRSGVFICGGKGTTKSNLGKTIAHKFMKLGYTVKVFDISKAWLCSSVPYYMEIASSVRMNIKLYQSIVFDLGRLIPKDVKRFITQILSQEWNMQVSVPESQRKWIIYVFEEVQALIPQGHLRSDEAQVLLRLLTSGRNYKLAYIGITQRPALTDTSVFELSFQRYFSRCDGENDKKKIASYIGEKAYDLQKLALGQFIYDKGSESKWIFTYEFKPKKKPIEIKPMVIT